MKQNKKILVCYNAPVSLFSNYNGKPLADNSTTIDLSEYSFANQIQEIVEILLEEFSVVESFSVDKNIIKLIDKLNEFNPDAIVNFIESVEGITNYEYSVAGLFELLDYQFTGNSSATLGNCLNKERTKIILSSYGINIPRFLVLEPGKQISRSKIKLNFPIIMKLDEEDASIGISEFSVVKNFKELIAHYKFLSKTYNKKILLEEYIEGREINVAILNGKTLPISEIDFTGLPDELPRIVTYEGKWIEGSEYYKYTKPVCPAKLNQKTKSKIEKIALKAYEVMSCRDYARVDIRLTKENTPYLIEVNPNPDISFDSGFVRAANSAGISYKELLKTITNFALERKLNDPISKAI
jgi:D-alanine-D-alanine ligase